jgi:hypothetical protein
MTNRTWITGGVDNFNDPAAWTPDGAPQSGDVLTIAEGNPVATDLALQGLTLTSGPTLGFPDLTADRWEICRIPSLP